METAETVSVDVDQTIKVERSLGIVSWRLGVVMSGFGPRLGAPQNRL
jgi:hypothetical protein